MADMAQSELAKFQPTRPLRGATQLLPNLPGRAGISTHAPLAGRDFVSVQMWYPLKEFQPTRPLRGATVVRVVPRISFEISTHAPLAGRDFVVTLIMPVLPYFNPRAPCGARLACTPMGSFAYRDFNPRAPCGARQEAGLPKPDGAEISTHAPLAGRDSKRVQITMHIFAITDKFQMLLHRMPPVRAFCSFLMQENHADFGCEPPK